MQITRAEFDIEGGEIMFDSTQFHRFGYHRGFGPMQQPGECDLRGTGFMALSNFGKNR